MRAQGEICDIDGRCVDAAEDELFKLTTKGGKLVRRSLPIHGNPRATTRLC